MAQDPMVIRGRVRAWLLGIRLLTLEAHITAADEDWPGGGWPAPTRPMLTLPVSAGRVSAGAVPAGPASARAPSATPVIPVRSRGNNGQSISPVPGAGVARARQLVDQGVRALDEGRRGRG